MRAPIACANLYVPPRAVHVDERHRWLRSMQRHDLAAKRGGLQQRGIVELLAEAPALVEWRDCELAERPGVWLAQELDFGCWIWPGQRDGCDDLATELPDEANSTRDAFLGFGHRLVRCPIPQAAGSVGRIRRVNKLSQRVQVVRCRNAPYVEMIGHVPVPSNAKMTGPPTQAAKPPPAVVGPRRLKCYAALPDIYQNLYHGRRTDGNGAVRPKDSRSLVPIPAGTPVASPIFVIIHLPASS